MKKLACYVLFGVMALIFNAYSSYYDPNYTVLYDTTPPCAKLICDGEFKGYTSIWMKLDYPKEGISEDGILYTQKCKAVFSSGYEAEFSNRIDTNKFETGIQETIKRPSNTPNAWKDWEFMCSNACIYAEASNQWSMFSALYIHERKSVEDVFWENKRRLQLSGICP
ncbi:hypothetical protein [Helicobacter sp. 23-1045]